MIRKVVETTSEGLLGNIQPQLSLNSAIPSEVKENVRFEFQELLMIMAKELFHCKRTEC